MTTPRQPDRCACGSRASYSECCGPLHQGRSGGTPTAVTAEQLMRSRYSAYALGDADYLLATWHRSSRPAGIDPADDVLWRRLQVMHTVEGREGDDHGIVEFVAHFQEASTGEWDEMHERSGFVREGGEWFYLGEAR